MAFRKPSQVLFLLWPSGHRCLCCMAKGTIQGLMKIDDTLLLQQIHCFTQMLLSHFFWPLVPRKHPIWVQLNVSILSLKEKGRMLKNIRVFWTK